MTHAAGGIVKRHFLFSLGLAVLLSLVRLVSAQDQCGFSAGISFPVDRAFFTLVQDFGAPSPRHQGRYHTGEDYHGPRGASFGQPVRAAASGLVTYSAPNGWGRDGGVVIIEHAFADGTKVYSQYGHMMETDAARFPARYSCVNQGDIIGAVGNVRPAPHLHFEIRTNQPDVPGPGYSWNPPADLGWLQPTRFILTMNARLNPAYRWLVDLPEPLTAPPLILSDGSLMALSGDRLRGITPDGRVLWRLGLAETGTNLLLDNGLPVVVYASGAAQVVTADGQLGQALGTVALPPAPVADLLALPDGRRYALDSQTRVLTALNPDGSARWQTPLDLASVEGQVALLGDNLLLATRGGDLVAVQDSTGARCGGVRLYAGRGAQLWLHVGGDGIVRVGLSDQITGLDGRTLLGGCA